MVEWYGNETMLTPEADGSQCGDEQMDERSMNNEIRENDGTLVIPTNDAPAGMGNYPSWYYEDME